MPSIVRHGAGWRVQYREGGRGSPVLKSPTFKTKTAAAIESQRIAGRLKARGPVAGLIPWGELIERYCLAHADCVPAHLLKVRTTLDRLARDHTWTSAASVTVSHLPGLRDYQRRLLRAILAHAADLDQPVDSRVISGLRTRAPRRKPVDLISSDTVAAVQAAADAWGPGHGLLIHLVSTYGHRAESLVGLTWGAVDLAQATIRLRVKSMDIVAHDLIPATIARLKAMPPGDPAEVIIRSHHLDKPDGDACRPWRSGAEVSVWMTQCLRPRAGILDLRRYAITRMLDLTGGDARTVAGITGHRTPSLLLNLYARTNDQRKAALVASMGKNIGGEPQEPAPVIPR